MSKVFITIALIFGSVVGGFFYMKPAWQEFQTIRGETEALRQTSIELDQLLENHDKIVQTINSISKEDIRRIDQAFPTGPKSGDFLVLLETLSLKRNLNLKRVDLASLSELKDSKAQPRPGGLTLPTAAPGTIKEFPITLSIGGSYDALKGFLADLEKNVRLIDIQSISFAAPGRPDQFEFTLRGKTYYQ